MYSYLSFSLKDAPSTTIWFAAGGGYREYVGHTRKRFRMQCNGLLFIRID